MVATSARALVLLLVGAVLVAVFGATAPGGASVARTAGPGGHASALVDLQTAPETDNTITRIVVHENGSATWTLQIRTRLATDESEAEYRAFQDRFRENTSRYLEDFREGITGIVGNARGVTGREMRTGGFTASTSVQSIPRRWGVVTFEFRWDGFAAVEGDRLVVGDVFQGGLFIAEGDSLEVVAPSGYRIASAEPEPDELDGGVATWTGREDFADRRPRVVVASASAAGPGTLPWSTLVGGTALLAAIGLSAVGYRRLRGQRGGAGPGEPADARAAGAGAGADAGEDGRDAHWGDERLLADQDHVRKALVERGGRMRQKEVKDELGWSRSKTSRVLARMEEDGEVEKLRLGRENVIALPEDGDAVEE